MIGREKNLEGHRRILPEKEGRGGWNEEENKERRNERKGSERASVAASYVRQGVNNIILGENSTLLLLCDYNRKQFFSFFFLISCFSLSYYTTIYTYMSV